MLTVIVILFVVIAVFCFVIPGRENSGFMNRTNTDFIKGISILMIMIAHISVQMGDSGKLIVGRSRLGLDFRMHLTSLLKW